jgi:nitrite reductase (NADH) small subunit/3-phenylpropionate/trans-cinnamate dioxygenase ferredoxin subunit
MQAGYNGFGCGFAKRGRSLSWEPVSVPWLFPVSSMPRQFRVAPCDEVPQGEGRAFDVGDRIIAIFHVDGDFCAIDDACPHMGASLAAGYLDGCVVTCPLHAWRFNVRDGTWMDNPRVSTDHYPVVVVDGWLVVTVPEPDDR